MGGPYSRRRRLFETCCGLREFEAYHFDANILSVNTDLESEEAYVAARSQTSPGSRAFRLLATMDGQLWLMADKILAAMSGADILSTSLSIRYRSSNPMIGP